MSTVGQSPLTPERIRSLADDLAGAYEELLCGESVAAQAHVRAIVAEWSSDVMPLINARIGKCHDLVRRGLRDEALGLASESPDVFGAADCLNLERFGRDNYAAWIEAGRAAGIAPPPAPHFDKLSDLEKARQRLIDLRPLLERWRRMNVERAPLPRRIAMLRELVANDSDNSVWHEMLAGFEAYRLMQIKADVGRLRERFSRERGAAAAGTEREAESLLTDLRGEWSTREPPAGILEQVAALVADARTRRVDATLDGLVEELESAFRVLDADRGGGRARLSGLYRDWGAALAERGVIDTADPRLTRVAPICEYVERVREYDALVVEVDQRERERPATLADRIAWSGDLDRMMNRIDDAASWLPAADVDPTRIADLSDRAARVAESVRREVAVRRVTRLAAAAAACLLVAAVAWAAYALRRHRSGVEEAVAQAEAAAAGLAAGGNAPVDLGVAWTEPVRNDPEVRAAVTRVKAAEQSRDARRSTLDGKLSQFAAALQEIDATDRGDPLSLWPAAFSRAAQLIAEVQREKLAIIDEERARLEQPAALLRAKAKEFTDAADAAFEERVRRLDANVAEAESAMQIDAAAAEAGIMAAERELETLRQVAATAACPAAGADYERRKIVSVGVPALVAPESKVVTRLSKARERRAVLAGLSRREDQADRLLREGKYSEYADAIREIAKDLATGQLTRDYPDAAKDHATWKAVADWSHFAAKAGPSRSLTAQAASELLESLRRLPPEVMQLPDARAAKAWMEPWLERLSVLTPEKRAALVADYVKLFDSQFGDELDGVVTGRSGVAYPRYYCLLKDRPKPTEVKSFSYVTGLPDAAREWPTKQLRFDPDTHIIVNSPQKQRVDAAKKVLASRAAEDPMSLDRLAVDVLRTWARRDEPADGEPECDPCLQAIMLHFLIKKTCDASPAIAAGLGKSLAAIDAGKDRKDALIRIKGVDNSAYGKSLNPGEQDSVEMDRYRGTCAAFVRQADSELVALAEELARRAADVATRRAGLRQVHCVGRLRKEARGGWSITGGDPAARAGRPIFTASGLTNASRMQPCAVCDGNGNIPSGTEVKARAGDPVFVRESTERQGE